VAGSENQGPSCQKHTFPNFGWSRTRLKNRVLFYIEKLTNEKKVFFPDYLKTPYFPKFWPDKMLIGE
jgi:hypothetical protein